VGGSCALVPKQAAEAMPSLAASRVLSCSFATASCHPFEAAGLDQIGHCAHLVDVCLGGEDCGFLGHVEVHVTHLCVYPGHHGHGWATTLGVPFVQLLRRLSHRVEFLGPPVAACCAFYHPLEACLGEPWIHTSYMLFSMPVSTVITSDASS
jgi:hypothetical protein